MKVGASQSMGLGGAVRGAVQLADGTVRAYINGKRVSFGKNMILNQGMNRVAMTPWADCFTACAIGTGDTASYASGSGSTLNQSGTTVTVASGPFTFAATDVGKTIRWGTGRQSLISEYTNPTTVTVSDSMTTSGGAFDIYHTDRTGLDSETDRTTHLVDFSNGTVFSNGKLTMTRKFTFGPYSGNRTIREVGFSWTNTRGDNLFSRHVTENVLSLEAGQVLHIKYDLGLTLAPATPRTTIPVIPGWPEAPTTSVNGTEQIQLVGLSSVSSTGRTAPFDAGGYANEPSAIVDMDCVLSEDAQAHAAVGSAVDRSAAASVNADIAETTYTENDFSLIKTAIFPAGTGTGGAWRTAILGNSRGGSNPTVNNTFVYLFDEAQTKGAGTASTFNFVFSWGRSLG